jgi:probable HAF family extracellular repeat protein
MVSLGYLAGGTNFSYANGVNADGSIIVGQSDSAIGPQAYRWTQATGMVGLGILTGGLWSSASNVSGDGTVVVGISDSTNGDEAFRWTESTGMVGLGDLAGGTFASVALAVNSDGTVIVGKGTTASGTEAFIAKSTKGMIGITDFTTSIESINGVAGQTISNVSTLLHGAHGHLEIEEL